MQVALVREAGRAASRLQEGPPGGVAVPGHLEQVRADGVEPVAGRDPLVGREALEQVKSGAGTADHGDGDGVIQRHHRISGDPQ